VTTIVYRDGILAADTQVTRTNGIIDGNSHKIFRLGCGGVIGLAGRLSLFSTIKDIVKAKGEGFEIAQEDADRYIQHNKDENIEALIISKDGKIFNLENDMSIFAIDCDYAAIGTGALIALGALSVGASAIQAIDAAKRHDAFTGGYTEVFNLSDGEREPSKA
jgi:ATP-dependent protease HslVU (ClpYQ) peptidase subunit